MNILVVGSINIDLVLEVQHIVKRGETILSSSYERFFGGKGSNQAVACARLGANVSFIGAVGNDDDGKSIINLYESLGINTNGVQMLGQTGMAMIQLSEDGENAIVLVPGANDLVMPEDIDSHATLFDKCDVLLIQQEIPMKTVERAIELAHSKQKKIILNPAPVKPISDFALSKVDFLTPNEVELASITGSDVNSVEDALRVGQLLLQKGVKNVITTLGKNGSVWVNHQTVLPALSVSVVDTTGAGDAFNAGFAVGIASNLTVLQAMELGTKVAAHVVQQKGAQPLLPSIDTILGNIYR